MHLVKTQGGGGGTNKTLRGGGGSVKNPHSKVRFINNTILKYICFFIFFSES